MVGLCAICWAVTLVHLSWSLMLMFECLWFCAVWTERVVFDCETLLVACFGFQIWRLGGT